MTNLKISRMNFSELQIAIDWAEAEGWNPGLNDAECFMKADPHGFFKGEVEGEIIAVGSGVVYSDSFAFCGFYIVKPGFRGQRYGIELTKARLDYIGDRTTGIDGVIEMTDKYANLGYLTAHKNIRYKTLEPFDFQISPNIRDLKKIPFDQISKYDQKYFPARRDDFLKCWIAQRGHISLAYMEEGVIEGIVVARKCVGGYKIGPLFAENPAIADSLFQAVSSKLNGAPVFLDIPEPNDAAIKLVKRYKMESVFETARMYRNGKPNLNLNSIYGITTFELG